MMNALRSSISLALLALVWSNHALAATGPIRIVKDFPHSFQYQSGERFFPMGDTAYFLIAQPTNVIARFIDSRRAHQFNFIRTMSGWHPPPPKLVLMFELGRLGSDRLRFVRATGGWLGLRWSLA